MPIWLRKFYYKKIEEAVKKTNEQVANKSKKSNNTKISRPAIHK